MKILIDGQEYEAVDPSEMTLAEGVLLRKQSTDFGMPLSLLKIDDLVNELLLLPQDQRRDSAPMELYSMVQIWITRRRAGEKVTFEEASTYKTMSLVLEPSDAPEEVGEPDPPKPRAVSARGDANRPNRGGKNRSAKKSSSPSTNVSSISA